MKSIIKRVNTILMVFMMLLTVYGSVNITSAYELTETAEGRVLKISTAELYETWVKNRKCDHLIIFGKLSQDAFLYLEGVAEYCETLDMSDLEIDAILHQSFIENVNLKKVILPKNLKEIEFNCFSGCYNLETVVLPESLREIGHGSFQCCPRLKMQVSSRIKFTDDDFYHSPGVTIVEAEPEVPSCRFCSWVWDWMKFGSGHCEKKDA